MGLFDPKPHALRLGNTDLYVGPAGWSYADWQGRVYPESTPKGFREPSYLAQFYNTIELNNTFYRPPRADYCVRWVRDVAANPHFLFTAKLWKRFTHDREHRWTAADAATYRDGIAPLAEAGRLGAVLVQFPWSFHFNAENCDWLIGVVDEFQDMPLVLEVRAQEWLRDEPMQWMRRLRVGFCNVDQPALRGNIPLTSFAFGATGYLRLHGRNAEAWFAEDAGRDQRYDYLYDEGELRQLQGAIEEIAGQVEGMFVIANNHYGGQAVATSTRLIELLTGEEAEAPGRIRELYGI